MDVDWNAVFGLSVAPAELIVRGTAMYLFLWTLFRVVVKRRIGSIGMADLLVLVIIADASQNAAAGEYTTLTEGAILVGTIIGWNYVLDWAGYRFPRLQRLLEPARPSSSPTATSAYSGKSSRGHRGGYSKARARPVIATA